jgi:hypothetical protein
MTRRLLIVGFLLLAGCTSPRIRTAQSFYAARHAGDLQAARTHLADDPRLWYETRTGEGGAWNLEGGRWKNWDDHFNGTSDVGAWHAEGDRVWAVVDEMNDYFKLCEAGPSAWMLTYFFDEDGRIKGMMVSGAPPRHAGDRGRRAEFNAWLEATHPDDYAYLRPGGSIDPTGDRPSRTRELLHEWRREVGLPPIE